MVPPSVLAVVLAAFLAQDPAPGLAREEALVEEASRALDATDYAAARDKSRVVIDALLALPANARPASWPQLLDDAGRIAWVAKDVPLASRAYQALLEACERGLPEDSVDLQRARLRAALMRHAVGDFAGARQLEEKALAVLARAVPEDDQDLLRGRQYLAATLRELGDLHGALEIDEGVLRVLERSRPETDSILQDARMNVAATRNLLGDLRGAREMFEKLHATRARTLPEDHVELQLARINLGAVLSAQGEYRAARVLEESALRSYARTLPPDSAELQTARTNLAGTLHMLGDLPAARVLEEQSVAALARTLPDDHPLVQIARSNLAATLQALGDLPGARVLQERVLEVESRTLPDDHPSLRSARLALAGTLYLLRELEAARVLGEKALEVCETTLPEDHPDLQAARQNLAATRRVLGDFDGARAVLESSLEVAARTLHEDHPYLRTARTNLAQLLRRVGELDGAAKLEEEVLASAERTLPEQSRDLQSARIELAETLLARGAPAGDAARARAIELIASACRASAALAREVGATAPAREAEERCAALGTDVDLALSVAFGYGIFERVPALELDAFAFAEATRNAGLAASASARKASASPQYAAVRERLRAASANLAALAQRGTSSEEFRVARAKRESAERELLDLARGPAARAGSGRIVDAATLSAALQPGTAAVAFRRWTRTTLHAPGEKGSGPPFTDRVDGLCAFVVRPVAPKDADARPLVLLDLGPLAPIEAAALAWRDAIGVGPERGLAIANAGESPETKSGSELRRRVLDPVLAAAGGARSLVVVLDDVLHLVPLDALPLDREADSKDDPRVFDRCAIEFRASLSELLDRTPPSAAAETLLALGGASFNSQPLASEADDSATTTASEKPPATTPVRLADTRWSRGFEPLPFSGQEAHALAALHDEVFEERSSSLVLERRRASRAALEAQAPRARWLHLATHGWFASESVRSWSDPEPLDLRSGLGPRPTGDEQVTRMSPMLLCGLALSGANLPEDSAGSAPGLITAEELSTLELSGCELAVLSACDTNAGVRRAGQGVASLQRALQMSGARSVITSSWKVPDEATKDLMLDFYRRLWVEKATKAAALARAKRAMRDARDTRGRPKYAVRDWAAWVLTGEPD